MLQNRYLTPCNNCQTEESPKSKQSFPCLFLVFSSSFPCLFLVFSLSFPSLFLVFSWSFPGLFLVFSWSFPGLFLVFSQSSQFTYFLRFHKLVTDRLLSYNARDATTKYPHLVEPPPPSEEDIDPWHVDNYIRFQLTLQLQSEQKGFSCFHLNLDISLT